MVVDIRISCLDAVEDRQKGAGSRSRTWISKLGLGGAVGFAKSAVYFEALVDVVAWN
jgi:hypothetical protein